MKQSFDLFFFLDNQKFLFCILFVMNQIVETLFVSFCFGCCFVCSVSKSTNNFVSLRFSFLHQWNSEEKKSLFFFGLWIHKEFVMSERDQHIFVFWAIHFHWKSKLLCVYVHVHVEWIEMKWMNGMDESYIYLDLKFQFGNSKRNECGTQKNHHQNGWWWWWWWWSNQIKH